MARWHGESAKLGVGHEQPDAVVLCALLGGPWLVFGCFVGRELCLITYGLNRRLRYRKNFFILAKILACVVFLAGAIFLAASESRLWIVEPLMYLFFVLFLV